jgi:hypothetical protein
LLTLSLVPILLLCCLSLLGIDDGRSYRSAYGNSNIAAMTMSLLVKAPLLITFLAALTRRAPLEPGA